MPNVREIGTFLQLLNSMRALPRRQSYPIQARSTCADVVTAATPQIKRAIRMQRKKRVPVPQSE